MKKHLFTYVIIIILILTALSIMLIQVVKWQGRKSEFNKIQGTMSVSVDSMIPDTDSNDSMEEGESNSYDFIELNGISGSIIF